jgi:hypothetical protein
MHNVVDATRKARMSRNHHAAVHGVQIDRSKDLGPERTELVDVV